MFQTIVTTVTTKVAVSELIHPLPPRPVILKNHAIRMGALLAPALLGMVGISRITMATLVAIGIMVIGVTTRHLAPAIVIKARTKDMEAPAASTLGTTDDEGWPSISMCNLIFGLRFRTQVVAPLDYPMSIHLHKYIVYPSTFSKL